MSGTEVIEADNESSDYFSDNYNGTVTSTQSLTSSLTHYIFENGMCNRPPGSGDLC